MKVISYTLNFFHC